MLVVVTAFTTGDLGVKLKKLKRAVVEDALGALTGFPLTGTASLLITDGFVPWAKGLRERTYLDWELKDWPHIYADERSVLEISYDQRTYRLPQFVLFDNSATGRKANEIRISKSATSFSVPKDIRVRTEEAFSAYLKRISSWGKTYHNDVNVRLIEIATKEGVLNLVVQDVEYENYIRTNLVLDYDIDGRGTTLRKVVHRNRILEPLAESPLANNLGINILIFTIDGQLIIQKRSNKVIVRPNEYCPSASGTISSADIPMSGALLSDIPLMREAMEELGCRIADNHDICLLGITRELIRGGEPELFFAARSSLSAAEVVSNHGHARDRFESKSISFFKCDSYAFDQSLDDPENIARFVSLVDKLIDEFQDQMSIPLWTAIALWKKARLAGTSLFADKPGNCQLRHRVAALGCC